MSQHDYNIANQSFPSFRTDLNNALSAIQTTNSGTSLPTGAVAGQIWLDTTNATNPTLKFYDGADSISLATINYTANTVDWLDSSVTITGLSTTATGTVLTLSDTVSTSTVNLIIDNQKEIRFRETTANGTNYVGFKAPASLTADKIWVLPSADGTAGQFLKTDGAGNLSFSSDLPTTSFTGATVETSIADADLVLIYDDSATAIRKMTKANLVAGIGASAGQVIQVVQGTTTSTGSTTSTSDVTTNLSASITPSSSSNKILVIVSQTHFAVGTSPTCLAKLWRGTIGSGTELGRKCFGAYGLNIELASPADFVVLDTPATTSSVTYNTSVAFKTGSRVDYNIDRDSGTQKVTMNLLEIKG